MKTDLTPEIQNPPKSKISNSRYRNDTYLENFQKTAMRTAMGTKCAAAYACLTVGYQEEIKLFTQELPKHFSIEECELIEEVFK